MSHEWFWEVFNPSYLQFITHSSGDKMLQEKSFEDFKVDDITIGNNVIEQAKKDKPDAIHAIGCGYARMNRREKAIKWLGISAAMGFEKSQLELGHLFAKSGDIECALEWYLRPRKEPAVPFHVGKIMFERERYREAMFHYEGAALLGDANAQLQLGLGYYNCWGLDKKKVDKPTELSVSCSIYNENILAMLNFHASALGGNSLAAYHMGRIFEYGEGTGIDKYQALSWYIRSQAGGHVFANKCIERLNKQGYVHVPQRKSMTLSEVFSYSVAVLFILIVIWLLIKHLSIL